MVILGAIGWYKPKSKQKRIFTFQKNAGNFIYACIFLLYLVVTCFKQRNNIIILNKYKNDVWALYRQIEVFYKITCTFELNSNMSWASLICTYGIYRHIWYMYRHIWCVHIYKAFVCIYNVYTYNSI